MLASMAKLKAGRLAREVTDACLQYWGGMGFTWDNPARARVPRHAPAVDRRRRRRDHARHHLQADGHPAVPEAMTTGYLHGYSDDGARAPPSPGALPRADGPRPPAVPPAAPAARGRLAASARRPRSCCGTSRSSTSPASRSTTSRSPRRAASSRPCRGPTDRYTIAQGRRDAARVRARELRRRVPVLDPRARRLARARARPRCAACSRPGAPDRVQRGAERDVLHRSVQPRHAALLDGLQRSPARARRRSVRRREARQPPAVGRLPRRRRPR